MKKTYGFIVLSAMFLLSTELMLANNNVRADAVMDAERAVGMAVNQTRQQADMTVDPLQTVNAAPADNKMVANDSPEEVFKGYRKNLEKRIFKTWKPPAYTEKRNSVVRFVLDKEGRLLTMTMVESSGVAALDQSVQDAVVQSAPFKHFPRKYKGEQMPFEFTFEYTPTETVAKQPPTVVPSEPSVSEPAKALEPLKSPPPVDPAMAPKNVSEQEVPAQ